ncbi:MAG TPA: hypothetical protein VL117_15025 [Thermoleophilia bacterium]|nr:hypothetical protein [Thermoleophilia bacterium]
MCIRRVSLMVAVGATVVAVALSAGACSNGSTGPQTQSPAGSPSAAPASSFGLATIKQFGVTLRVPIGWVSASAAAKPGDTGNGPLLVATWADPKGKQVDGHYLDAIQVMVFELNKPATAADVTRHFNDFKAIGRQMIAQELGKKQQVAVSDPFKPITLNGTSGLQVTYSYLVGTTPAGAMSYLLPKGRYAYWVTGQASAATWSTAWSRLAPAMASFTIKTA